ncbi:hypothetical protein ASPTUDRAFT_56758 [Aspergillus tubingensis CBS 134.48]|uniref:Uncharacterized protein n=1 Tax=Aspergillus tubingensis (strain CBS 134.48) TaxID=767770 RepID=A0A1L9N0C3_ASPTC|nr:hypothetical protein ASPTUDRAFT_56758 [Aspergillus tubingensis CBS 134.48]
MGRRRSEAEGSNTTSIEVKQHNCFTSRDVVIDPVKVVQVDQSRAKEIAGPSKGCRSSNMGTGITNLGFKSRRAIKVSVLHCDMIHEYAFSESTLALLVKAYACPDDGSGIYRRLSELRGRGRDLITRPDALGLFSALTINDWLQMEIKNELSEPVSWVAIIKRCSALDRGYGKSLARST